MIDRERKLKRGLKDISPLFRKTEDVQKPSQSNKGFADGIECLSVFHPDKRWSSLFLSGYLASKIASTECPCTIVSLGSRYSDNAVDAASFLRKEFVDQNVRWVSFNWEYLQHLWRSSGYASFEKISKSQRFFIDFDYTHAVHFEKIMPLLDKWIVLVRPDTESLMEAYKALKATIPLNRHLEYYFLMDGFIHNQAASFVYEKFSEVVSRRLGINMGWLGCVNDQVESRSSSAEIALENLCMERVAPHQSVEKRMLAGLLRSSFELVI